MSIRTLLAPLALILALLVTPEVSHARSTADMRYQDGVALSQTQREGLQEIVGIVRTMDELADLSLLSSSTQAFRMALNSRFQDLIWRIHTVAYTTESNGYFPLIGLAWYSVEATPGSSESVTIHGMDASSAGIGVTGMSIDSWSNALMAIAGLSSSLRDVQAGLHRNCSDLAALGVDGNCGSMLQFCRSQANSTGYPAWLWGGGDLVAGSEEQLFLSTQSCPHGDIGWFIMGQAATNIPFGNGRLCISRGAGGIHRLSPGEVINSSGIADFSVADANSQFISLIHPGTTWYFQFIFMDSPVSGMDSTNALRVTFEP